MPLKFVEYDRRFLLASRRWLRDPELAALTMTPPFTDEEQERWFAALASRTNYRIWGVELDDTPVGVVGLKNISAEQAEYFGYLGEKSAWGSGYGHQLMLTAINEAKLLGCQRLVLRVWRENQRAIALYSRHGFKTVREDGVELYMERHV